ncbi:putative cobalt transporter CbtA [Actinomadura coerulea]|uniref:Putative cobalt transporter CbtA n=1 Tax=Actinomadura coerulea TaxID=46159 RepID=A0A7X0KZ60_9ACTN|nr:CbtA family protein [Actinomadura coerulea]MBB6395824.1 putative cobalt transporter CbtA [Actinomadura coerulea]GGQ27367.1 membrane protein [Actinomadura coerulea]
MVRTLLVRGLLLGLLAGLVAGVFAFAVGEPRIDDAIALEKAAAVHEHGAAAEPGSATHGHETGTPEQRAGTHGKESGTHEHGDEVGRGTQKAGLFLATGLYGLAVGGVFSLAFAGLRGRVGPRSDAALALATAGTAFAAVIVVPFLKYPANPPAVGDPETINTRTLLYLAMIGVGLLSTAIAVTTVRGVRGGPWARWPAAVLAFVVPVAVASLLLPAVDEVPDGFPATLLWQFRITSLGTQLVFWASFGTLFGWFCDRAARAPAPA